MNKFELLLFSLFELLFISDSSIILLMFYIFVALVFLYSNDLKDEYNFYLSPNLY